jgi:hypothetical protein
VAESSGQQQGEKEGIRRREKASGLTETGTETLSPNGRLSERSKETRK